MLIFMSLKKLPKELWFKSKWRHHRWDVPFAVIQATSWQHSKFSFAVIAFFGVVAAQSHLSKEGDELTVLPILQHAKDSH